MDSHSYTHTHTYAHTYAKSEFTITHEQTKNKTEVMISLSRPALEKMKREKKKTFQNYMKFENQLFADSMTIKSSPFSVMDG